MLDRSKSMDNIIFNNNQSKSKYEILLNQLEKTLYELNQVNKIKNKGQTAS